MTLCYILPVQKGSVNTFTDMISSNYPYSIIIIILYLHSYIVDFKYSYLILIIHIQLYRLANCSQGRADGSLFNSSKVSERMLLLSLIIQGPLVLWVKCSLMAWETGVQFQVKSYQRLKKWYLIPQHHKVCIKGKVEQSRERSTAFPYTSV